MPLTFSDFKKSTEGKRDHYLLFGHPVAHSLSPLIHQYALDICGLEATYTAVDLQPDEIPAAIAWIHGNHHFKGANVTIPYKQILIDAVDDAGEDVSETGALNTLKREENGVIKAINTDIQGFLKPLEPYLDEVTEAPVVLFGTGGAARAVFYALKQIGVQEVVMVSRNPGRAEHAWGKALDDPELQLTLTGMHDWVAYAGDSFLIVNATPAGMKHFPADLPVPESSLRSVLETGGSKLLYDLVYTPYYTPLLIAGQENGSIILHGLDMFIHQAAASFEFWTGVQFPLEPCRTILKNRLNAH